MGIVQQCSSSAWPFKSILSACFAALVVLGFSVSFFEYCFFFTSDGSDHADRKPSLLPWRTPTPNSRPPGAEGVEIAEVKTSAVLAAVQQENGRGRKLAVVVPSHAGDLDRALASLAKWPTRCHESTLVNAELLLYYAGGPEDRVAASLPSFAQTGGKCFAATRLIFANLNEEVRAKFSSPAQSIHFFSWAGRAGGCYFGFKVPYFVIGRKCPGGLVG